MKKSFGFTMIELLVVIAVIGVLAVAVLSSLDPIEQINKGRDTRVRSNAAQLMNAVDRYYAIQEVYPWNEGVSGYEPTDEFPDDGTVCAATSEPAGFCQLGGEGYSAGDQAWLQSLADTNEVKASFITQVENDRQTNALYVFKRSEASGGDDSVYVCFTPSSKAFQLEAVKGCIERRAVLPDGACLASYAGDEEWTDELICLP